MDSLLTGANLFYPSAKDWMWNYCIYLGPFTDSEGENYDLGIHMGRLGVSAAIVWGDEPGQYMSGGLKEFGRNGGVSEELYGEVRKRAAALKLYEDE